MKTIKNKSFKLICILLLSSVLNACEGFLEVAPTGRTTTPVLFSDMDGMRSAVHGMYKELYDFYDSELLMYPEVAGDMVDVRMTSDPNSMIQQFNFNSDPSISTGAIEHIWLQGYFVLASVNNILKYEPDLSKKFELNRDELTQIRGEALFVRALCHFWLCNCYGQPYTYTEDASHMGIPIVTSIPGADDNISRNSVNEVYDLIIDDLTNAIRCLENEIERDAHYISLDAAKALMSRVYLYMEKWDKVIEYSDDIIANTELSYGDKYFKMFDYQEINNECIFRLSGFEHSSSLASAYSGKSMILFPADKFIALFDNQNDIRLNLLQDKFEARVTTKYYPNESIGDERHSDPIVFRTSEMYLNRIEAYLNLSTPDIKKAKDDLSILLARSLSIDKTEIVITTNDVDELKDIVDLERAKELCFEGHRFFDIIRKKQDLVRGENSHSLVKRIDYPSDYFVLPISQKELDANLNIKPNPTVNSIKEN